MQRLPLFEANCFIYWKNRFETYVKSKDINLWYIIAYGNYKPTIKDKDGKDVVTPYEKLDENQKKMLSKNDKAKMVLYNALPKKEYERIFMCDTAQNIWDSLITTHQDTLPIAKHSKCSTLELDSKRDTCKLNIGNNLIGNAGMDKSKVTRKQSKASKHGLENQKSSKRSQRFKAEANFSSTMAILANIRKLF
ncbi:hypothetical protein Tco_0599501 [Tanacetum coccineum]